MVHRLLCLICFMGFVAVTSQIATAQEPATPGRPCVAAPPMLLEVGDEAIVQRNNNVPLNMRDEASTYGSIIGELEPRTIVRVVGGPFCGRLNNQYTWWQIETDDGLVGWVAEGDAMRTNDFYFIMPVDNTETLPDGVGCGFAPESRVDVGSFADVNEGAGLSVVLRDSPSGRILDYLNFGTMMTIIDGPRCGAYNRVFKWWRVSTDTGAVGWVAEGDAAQTPPLYFINPVSADDPRIETVRLPTDPGCPASPPTVLRAGDVVEVGDVGEFELNLRSTPAGTRLGILEKDTLLEVVDGPVCGNFYAWWEVRVLEDGRRGWVAEGDSTQTPIAYFIRLVDPTAEAGAEGDTGPNQAEVVAQQAAEQAAAGSCQAAPPQQLTVGDPAVVLDIGGQSIALRSTPSIVATVLAELPPETYMTVLNGPRCGDGNSLYTWWQVHAEDGSIGWVQEGDAAQTPPVYFVVPVLEGS